MNSYPQTKLGRSFFGLPPIFKLLFYQFIVLTILLLYSCGSSDTNDYPTSKNEDTNLTQAEIIIDGQRQYHLRSCVKCHGALGRGDGYRTSSLRMTEKPRDFRNLSAYKQGSDKASIRYTIKHGIVNPTNEGKNPRSASIMPAYPMLTDIEIDHIAQYVIYLQTNN